MLTLRIANPAARPKAYLVPGRKVQNEADEYLSKQEILNRHLNKCYMKIGDRVALKRPKRPRLRGTLVGVEEDATKATWIGNQPKFMVVDIDLVDKATGTVYGKERRHVGVKQLLYTAG